MHSCRFESDARGTATATKSSVRKAKSYVTTISYIKILHLTIIFVEFCENVR